MAVRNPPDRLHFVFLDFKGGSAFSVIERLPHTVGSVCDLDLNHAVRALRGAGAGAATQEHLVAAERVGSIGQLQSPPPSLIVVIDEFHALNNQLPDYVDRLVRIASLGRSLGMHVIACTQNPLGTGQRRHESEHGAEHMPACPGRPAIHRIAGRRAGGIHQPVRSRVRMAQRR